MRKTLLNQFFCPITGRIIDNGDSNPQDNTLPGEETPDVEDDYQADEKDQSNTPGFSMALGLASMISMALVSRIIRFKKQSP